DLCDRVIAPCEQGPLPLKFVLARRDDLVQPVLLARRLELRVVERVKLEALRVFVLDVRARIELREDVTPSVERDSLALLQSLRRRDLSSHRERHPYEQPR